MESNTLYFIYGLCVMFYGMMTWVFGRRYRERLPRLVAALMGLMCAQSLKDLVFLYGDSAPDEYVWNLITASDMVAVPMYTFILTELCRPGRLTFKMMALHEAPFVILPILLAATRVDLFYKIDVTWGAIYGSAYAIWTILAIPGYHRHLREYYSYNENINLNWLRSILFSFFAILGLWTVDCLHINIDMESVYMSGTLVFWMVICYFIYRHETIVDEVTSFEPEEEALAATADAEELSELNRRINKLFMEDKIFLNPHLKLSEVATMAGTNRTYLSHYFNCDNGMTFFDYINNMRVDYASRLLCESDELIEDVASKSGFNSLSTFRRAFAQRHGCTPTEYRKSINDVKA